MKVNIYHPSFIIIIDGCKYAGYESLTEAVYYHCSKLGIEIPETLEYDILDSSHTIISSHTWEEEEDC